MFSVKSLTMTYDALNKLETFSEGDTLTGTVTLSLKKDITVQTLFVKFKGDANVQWKTYGSTSDVNSAHRRYFKLKQVLISKNDSKGKSC